MLVIYGQPSPVILDHPVDHLRVVNSCPIVIKRFFAHLIGGPAIPSVRISTNRSLWLFRLREKEPMPPSSREPLIASLQGFEDWNAVKRDKMRDRIRGDPTLSEKLCSSLG